MSEPRCGSVAGYLVHRATDGEACRPCLDARAYWQRHYRARMYLDNGLMTIDATGTRRRLHALMWMGWSADLIAAELGVTGPAVREWTYNRRVRRSTAAKVAALYDRWWDRPGPSIRTRARAIKAGWPPPLAYDDATIDDPLARPSVGAMLRHAEGIAFDEVAVQRAMYGDRVRLRPVERAEAVARLTARGLSARQIADRLGTTARTVTRKRAAS